MSEKGVGHQGKLLSESFQERSDPPLGSRLQFGGRFWKLTQSEMFGYLARDSVQPWLGELIQKRFFRLQFSARKTMISDTGTMWNSSRTLKRKDYRLSECRGVRGSERASCRAMRRISHLLRSCKG